MLQRHGGDGRSRRFPIAPALPRQGRRGRREAAAVGEEMPDQDTVLALLGERRPDCGDRFVEVDASPLDLLPERDGGEGFAAREDREECVRANQLPTLGVGVAADEVENEMASL